MVWVCVCNEISVSLCLCKRSGLSLTRWGAIKNLLFNQSRKYAKATVQETTGKTKLHRQTETLTPLWT